MFIYGTIKLITVDRDRYYHTGYSTNEKLWCEKNFHVQFKMYTKNIKKHLKLLP